jgi:D-alanine transaminase
MTSRESSPAVETAYVAGQVLPAAEAKVPLWDRGFMFAEAAYEAYVGRGGRIFAFAEHQERLRRTLEGIRIPEADRALAEVARAAEALVERHGRGMFLLYVQVTGGVAPRNHVLPKDPSPAVYAVIRAFERATIERDQERGVRVLTRPDVRWRFATYKTTQLLPNVIAKKDAREAGADEILFVDRDGCVEEGGSTNFLWVEQGRLFTTPLSRNLLPGVTRRLIFERCDLRVEEAEPALERVLRADEVMLAGTTREATGVIEIDGRRIGDGRPGLATRTLAAKLKALFDAECPA